MRNMKKVIAVVLTVFMLLSLFVGCGNNNNNENNNNNNQAANNDNNSDNNNDSNTNNDDSNSDNNTNNDDSNSDNNTNNDNNQSDSNVIAFEDIDFPDNLPVKPPMAEDGWYGYDNMDEKYTVEVLTHHYGVPALPKDEDPICIWLSEKFNLDLSLTALNNNDVETTLSTRFASNDEPDVSYLPTRELAFVLSDQGLLVDAKNIYPYMPQTCKFATKNMIAWSENKSNGELPFITKYGIQDGVWGFAIRKDWLETFGMDEPTTKDELLEYAVKCVEEDPDGDGQANTYFMTGAGSGVSFGMLGGFNTMFGNPSSTVEDGQLSHPIFNGVRKDFLMFLNELYEMDVLAPDWYTIDWETAKSYTMNDQIGMVWYPAGALYSEYTQGAKQKSMESLEVWHFWQETPIEGGKYVPSGNPGYMWGFASNKFEDEGKLKRVAHMLDTMVIGGENFFHTIQGGSNEVYENAGIEVESPRTWVYQDDGTFYLSNDPEAEPWAVNSKYAPTGIWQHFGLSVIWQLNDPSQEDPFMKGYAEKSNTYAKVINSYDRWPNDALRVTLTDEAAENQVSMKDWVDAQEIAFVTGERSFDEWDEYTEEWLNKGGKAIIEQTANSLGADMPDYAK